MKKAIVVNILFFYSFIMAQAQDCDIKIEILEDKYMFGQVSKLADAQSSKKMVVEFNNEFMEILLPVEGETYLIKVVNENCQAYCTRAKRIRQLNSGDEKLVKNLFKDKKEDILAQIDRCNNQ